MHHATSAQAQHKTEFKRSFLYLASGTASRANYGALALTTATAAKTSLFKLIRAFSNFVALIPIP